MRDTVLVGDVREKLAEIPAGSVHCVVTSPPYWALRDYGVAGQLGSEASPDEYLANQIEVFRGVRRALRGDGVCWVNLGDNYAANRSYQVPDTKHRDVGNSRGMKAIHGFPAGCQNLMPHRFALAMIADGWILRSTVIWSKRSPMPESISGWRWMRCRVKTANATNHDSGKNSTHIDRRNVGFNDRYDFPQEHAAKWSDCPGCAKCEPHGGYVLRKGGWRCTTAHEYMFQFVKSRDYYCDGEAVAEQCSANTHGKNGRNRQSRTKSGLEGVERNNVSFTDATACEVETRNPRSVWTLSSEPFRGAHFATFPTALPRRCIEASTSSAGCCGVCGSQYAPIVRTERVPTRPGIDNQIDQTGMANRDPQRHVARTIVEGYRATCGCAAADPVPAVVLDPYAGSGTTLQVAHQLGRSYIGIELNPEYVEMIRQRIEIPLKSGRKTALRRRAERKQMVLFAKEQ